MGYGHILERPGSQNAFVSSLLLRPKGQNVAIFILNLFLCPQVRKHDDPGNKVHRRERQKDERKGER